MKNILKIKKSNRRQSIVSLWRQLQKGFTLADRSWNPIMAE